jgi:hypothetical protein
MIQVSKILRMVRYKAKDNNEVRYSDYDIIQAVNETIRYMNQDLSLKNSDFLEKVKYYRQDEINAEIAEFNRVLDERVAATEEMQAQVDAGIITQDQMDAALGDSALTQAQADELYKEAVKFDTTGVDLPEDFLGLVDIVRAKDAYHLSPIPAVEQFTPFSETYGGYKIVGNKIYTRWDFDMLYRAELPQITDLENDTLELPVFFLDSIVKITIMVLANLPDTDVLMREVSRLCDSLVPRRRYNNIKIRMPWKV